MKHPRNNQKGFAAFFVTVLVMVVVFGIAASISTLTYLEQKIVQNTVRSAQAYYLAEAGIEDILLRLAKGMNWSTPYNLETEKGSASLEISQIIGGSRTIISQGNTADRIRKISAIYEISSEKLSFYYGAQIGDGGMIMDDGGAVIGNVFSNGPITAASNTEITDTAKAANIGNYIDGAQIGQDAYVDICNNSNIQGTLVCSQHTNCTASSIETLLEEIPPLDLPIPQDQINEWKNIAESGGIYSGDYILEGKGEDYLGPIKIEGNMVIQDQAQLFLTGTVWVTGNITIQNKSRVQLDGNSYGSNSGVIMSDSGIILKDSAKAIGSGAVGSYLLVLSSAVGDQAIMIQDDFQADIIYAQNGWIVIQNTTNLRTALGYGIHLKNNAELVYEVGLEDVFFSSGPQGGWDVTSWSEIE